MNKQPVISVIMPVYNAENFLGEAIQSILKQTFTDFEFIIIDDASTDRSKEIIQSSNDGRIQLIINNKNLGHHKSRNIGQQVARGKYFCAMDADDISFPTRLEKQFHFMEQNKDVGIAGSCIRFVGSPQNVFREPDYKVIKISLLHNNYICHPSVIMRKSLLHKYNLIYDESLWYAGDYDLWVRASKRFQVVNINEVFLNYRWSSQQMTASMNKYWHETERIRIQQIPNFGFSPTAEEEQIHLNLLNGIPIKKETKSDTLRWIDKLIKANHKEKYYDQEFLEDFFNALLNRLDLL